MTPSPLKAFVGHPSPRRGTDRFSAKRLAKAATAWAADRNALARRLVDEARELMLDWRVRAARAMTDEALIVRQHRAVFGCDPDFIAPRGFNEKTQWLKLHDVTPLHRRCADKLTVRDYVAETIGADSLAPLLLVAADTEAIQPERIEASRFVVKPTHDSGSTQVCFDRTRFDWARCRRLLQRSLARDYSFLHAERQYRDLPRRVIVEQFVDGARNRDYKFFCFGGEPHIVMVNVDRFGDFRENFYTADWQPLNVFHTYPATDAPVAPPAALGRMLEAARALAAPFRFARVDLYDDDGAVIFGEITFHQSAGLTPFDPSAFDLALGSLLPVADMPHGAPV